MVFERVLQTARSNPPVTSLDLSYVDVHGKLCQLVGLDALQRLHLGFSGVTATDLAALAALDLPALVWLDMMGLGLQLTRDDYAAQVRDVGAVAPARCTAPMVAPLVGSAMAARLQTLVLSHADFNAAACRALGAADWSQLRRLVLQDTRLEDAGAFLTGRQPALVLLERPGGFPAASLLGHPRLAQLECLRVPGTTWDDADDRFAEVVERATNLQELDLRSCAVGARTLASLARSQAPLRVLRLGDNQLTDDALAPLWQAPWIGTIETLDLRRNVLSDACVDAMLAASWDSPTLELEENALSANAFARIAARFGTRVRGGRRQNPALARQPGAIAAEIALVAATRKPAKAKWGKVPKRVQALGIQVAATQPAGWYVGNKDGHVVLVSKGGKVTEPDPTVEAHPLRLPVGVVHPGRKTALLMFQDGPIIWVDMDRGTSRAVGTCTGKPSGGVVVDDHLLVLHGSVAATATIQLFDSAGAAVARLDDLPGKHQHLALHPSGPVAVVGTGGFGRGPVSLVAVRPSGLSLVVQLDDGYTVVGTATDPLIKAGTSLFDLSGVEGVVRG